MMQIPPHLLSFTSSFPLHSKTTPHNGAAPSLLLLLLLPIQSNSLNSSYLVRVKRPLFFHVTVSMNQHTILLVLAFVGCDLVQL